MAASPPAQLPTASGDNPMQHTFAPGTGIQVLFGQYGYDISLFYKNDEWSDVEVQCKLNPNIVTTVQLGGDIGHMIRHQPNTFRQVLQSVTKTMFPRMEKFSITLGPELIQLRPLFDILREHWRPLFAVEPPSMPPSVGIWPDGSLRLFLVDYQMVFHFKSLLRSHPGDLFARSLLTEILQLRVIENLTFFVPCPAQPFQKGILEYSALKRLTLAHDDDQDAEFCTWQEAESFDIPALALALTPITRNGKKRPIETPIMAGTLSNLYDLSLKGLFFNCRDLESIFEMLKVNSTIRDFNISECTVFRELPQSEDAHWDPILDVLKVNKTLENVSYDLTYDGHDNDFYYLDEAPPSFNRRLFDILYGYNYTLQSFNDQKTYSQNVQERCQLNSHCLGFVSGPNTRTRDKVRNALVESAAKCEATDKDGSQLERLGLLFRVFQEKPDYVKFLG